MDHLASGNIDFLFDNPLAIALEAGNMRKMLEVHPYPAALRTKLSQVTKFIVSTRKLMSSSSSIEKETELAKHRLGLVGEGLKRHLSQYDDISLLELRTALGTTQMKREEDKQKIFRVTSRFLEFVFFILEKLPIGKGLTSSATNNDEAWWSQQELLKYLRDDLQPRDVFSSDVIARSTIDPLSPSWFRAMESNMLKFMRLVEPITWYLRPDLCTVLEKTGAQSIQLSSIATTPRSVSVNFAGSEVQFREKLKHAAKSFYDELQPFLVVNQVEGDAPKIELQCLHAGCSTISDGALFDRNFPQMGQGTIGMFIDIKSDNIPSGRYAVTCAHVIDPEAFAQLLVDGEQAEVLHQEYPEAKFDARHDYAFLKMGARFHAANNPTRTRNMIHLTDPVFVADLLSLDQLRQRQNASILKIGSRTGVTTGRLTGVNERNLTVEVDCRNSPGDSGCIYYIQTDNGWLPTAIHYGCTGVNGVGHVLRAAIEEFQNRHDCIVALLFDINNCHA